MVGAAQRDRAEAALAGRREGPDVAGDRRRSGVGDPGPGEYGEAVRRTEPDGSLCRGGSGRGQERRPAEHEAGEDDKAPTRVPDEGRGTARGGRTDSMR